MTIPDFSIVVTTFERPAHLWMCLRSLSQQSLGGLQCEVIVADDGSQGTATEQCVRQFARDWKGRVAFITQAKEGFRLAMCRNKAAAIARGKSLIFLDGDCIVPPHFVNAVLAELRPSVVVAGDCYRLSQDATQIIDESNIDDWRIAAAVSRAEHGRLAWKTIRARVYSLLSVPMRPRLTGCAFACHRMDLLRINGFDENFVGWGLEDRDIQRRFAMIGIRAQTVLHRVKAVHLWHPLDPTFARNGVGTANREYFNRPVATAYCEHGIDKYLKEEIVADFDTDRANSTTDWLAIDRLQPVEQAGALTRLSGTSDLSISAG